jgi:hypothetical protein
MGSMAQLRFQPLLVTVACLGILCASTAAQTVREDSHPAAVQGKAVEPVVHPMLFSPGSTKTEDAQAIEFRSLDQMTQKDRELAANAESSIAERATLAGSSACRSQRRSSRLGGSPCHVHTEKCAHAGDPTNSSSAKSSFGATECANAKCREAGPGSGCQSAAKLTQAGES